MRQYNAVDLRRIKNHTLDHRSRISDSMRMVRLLKRVTLEDRLPNQNIEYLIPRMIRLQKIILALYKNTEKMFLNLRRHYCRGFVIIT